VTRNTFEDSEFSCRLHSSSQNKQSS